MVHFSPSKICTHNLECLGREKKRKKFHTQPFQKKTFNSVVLQLLTMTSFEPSMLGGTKPFSPAKSYLLNDCIDNVKNKTTWLPPWECSNYTHSHSAQMIIRTVITGRPSCLKFISKSGLPVSTTGSTTKCITRGLCGGLISCSTKRCQCFNWGNNGMERLCFSVYNLAPLWIVLHEVKLMDNTPNINHHFKQWNNIITP